MSNQHKSYFKCLLILCVSSVCFGGKLDSLRGKTRDEVGSKVAKASSPAPKRDRSERKEEPKHKEPSENLAASLLSSISFTAEPKTREVKPQSKLSSVRDRVRRSAPKNVRPPINKRPKEDRPRHNRPPRGAGRPPRRGGRSPGGFGFSVGSAFPIEPCPPSTTLVTERIYYPQVPAEHWTYNAPYSTPVPYVDEPMLASPQLPPVMPPSPAEVITNDGMAASCEPCGELSCDTSISTTAEWPINPYHIRFEIDYAGDEGDVSRMGFGLLANITRGLGVDTGVRLFRERDTAFRDHLWLGDFNVTYELVATESMRMRAGLGVNFLADWYGADSGLNLTVGTDIFIGPVTLAGELDLGSLGDTDLFHGRVSAAWRCDDHIETFVGYDYVDIGGVEFAGVLAGLRFRY